MCGRFSVAVEPALVAERFRVQLPGGTRVRYNVAPTQPVLAVRRSRERGVVADELRWGLVPHWARDPSAGARLINARVETVAARPAFRDLLARRRCLIPADGFYEWRSDPDGRKRPLRFTLAGGEPFGLAGLWAVWRDPATGEWLRSCTILTCDPNELVAPVHDRMPVILPPGAEQAWLSAELDAAGALGLLGPLPADRMAFAEVSPLVGSPDNDCPECLDPSWGVAPPPDEQLALL